jgi:hypothetical protein
LPGENNSHGCIEGKKVTGLIHFKAEFDDAGSTIPKVVW